MSPRRSEIVGALVVGLVAAAQFTAAARLDPEPYHDGSQVAPAIAVAEGLVIHRQVFDAYGPITAWLQGAAMWFFGPTVLTARLLTAVLLVACTVLMFLVVSQVTRRTVPSVLFSLLWVAIWPGQAISWGTPLLPWPSVTFLVLQLAAVLLLLQRLRGGAASPARFAWIGALIGLSILTRANYGLPLLLAVLAVLFLIRRSGLVTRREVVAGSVGLLLSIGVPIAYLALNGAFVAFLDQSLIGPLVGDSDATSNGTEWFYWKNAYLWASVPLILSVVGLAILDRARVVRPWIIRLTGLAATAGLLLWTSAAIEGSPVRGLIVSRLTWAPALDGQVAQPMFVAAIFTILALLATASVLIVRARTMTGPLGASQRVFLVLVLTGAASLFQLYPIADPNHLWWSAPLPLALLATMLDSVGSRPVAFWLLTVATIPYLSIAVWSAAGFYGKPRTEWSNGVLAGMLIQERLLSDHHAVDALMRGVLPRSTAFLCDQGLFAVWNGQYLANSPAFVQWSHRLGSADTVPEPSQVIICTALDDQHGAAWYAQGAGLVIEETLPDVDLSDFTTQRMDKLVRNGSG